MTRLVTTLLAVVLFTLPVLSWSQIYPPKPGVDMPQAYYDRVAQDRNAFRFKRAWINKAKTIRENRERYIAEKGFYHRDLVAPQQKPQFSVTGTVRVPVFMVKFSNTGTDPYPTSTMDTRLFSGPFSPQTLTAYYDELSYGDLNMTGDVYGWTTLPNPDTYYEGGCQGLCGSAPIEELIIAALNDNDLSVDYGQYDNDGPDGVPNSGDDDGFIDFAAFVHPEAGGECSLPNIWSHRFSLTGLGSGPWTSDDAAAGGGFIRADDYVIQPAFNCPSGGGGVVDIGVYCHEFGHALGLPDLYDTNGGSAGIGHWDLMASGSWHTVTQPAHMSTWCKTELGWANIVEVQTKKLQYTLENTEFNRTAYRLNITEERWRRMADCALSGSYSMRCGLTDAEGGARGWAEADGYGDGWTEKVSREFSYDGNDPVTMQYAYDYESELNYDYTYGRIDVGGTVSTFATYNNVGSGSANIDLTPYLSGSGATSYTVSFEFESDGIWSDRDGRNGTTCGPFVFDDVSVVGGGENYSTDFETREDGWCADMTSPAEYFLVENRQPVGSDTPVHGGGGLTIYHINYDISQTGQGGNTGGSTNTLPRGVAVEQADGLFDLENNANRGDAGDPWPGSTSNTIFDNVSAPSSMSATGYANTVCVTNISANPANGSPMTAEMAAGWPLPTFASATPANGNDDEVVTVIIDGSGFVKGLTVELVDGANIVAASTVTWKGHDRVVAEIDLNGAFPSDYDLVITNPGNGCAVVVNGFTVNGTVSGVDFPEIPTDFALQQNYPNPFNPNTIIPFDLKERVQTTLKIYNVRGQVVRTLVNEVLDARSYQEPWDGTDDAGAAVTSGVYFYKLVAGSFQDVRKLLLMK